VTSMRRVGSWSGGAGIKGPVLWKEAPEHWRVTVGRYKGLPRPSHPPGDRDRRVWERCDG
jgi:hypothetical protein